MRRCAPLAPALAILVAAAAPAARGATVVRQKPHARHVVVRPQPLNDTVLYPKGAQGTAIVVLELVVTASGRVRDVRALSGEEPFVSAALSAARKWRFAPATRDGKPLAARIRFQVRFVPPPPPPRPSPKPAASAPRESGRAAPPAAPPRQKPIVVQVTGQREEPGEVTMTQAEVNELPGAFGDPFRAIGAMPGVTPIVSGVPYFFVRGAPPGNVGYFLDGIRVPYLYHVGLGPGVLNPALVDRVDLYSGGYPARYGRFAGAIVAGETTPPRYTLHGQGSVRLVDAGGMVEAPIAHRRGSVLVGGRYSYTGLLLSLISPNAVLRYWDYQARATYNVTDDDRIGVFGFGAYDFLGDKRNGRTQAAFDTQFHRIDLRWDHTPSPNTHLHAAVTFGLDETGGDTSTPSLRDRSIAVRTEIHHRASPRVLLRAGTDVTTDVYDIVVPNHPPGDTARIASLFPGRTDLAGGAWTDVVLKPASGITVTPGLRLDYYTSEGAAALGVDPRISARFAVSRHVRLVHTFGIAHQPPSFFVPIPGYQIGGLKGGLQTSLQSSAGVEVDLPAHVTGSLTLFEDAFFNMTDPLGAFNTSSSDQTTPTTTGSSGTTGTTTSGTSFADRLDTRSLGNTVGLELYLHRPLTRRLGGFLSYTLSRSMRSIGRETFPSSFDRTHVLNLALAYNLGDRWRAGTRFVFYTGFPAQQATPGVLRTASPDRIPPFWRIDLRLEKRWRLGQHGYWAFVAEILNATFNKETVSVSCTGPSCQIQKIGPVTIPSIGLEAEF